MKIKIQTQYIKIFCDRRLFVVLATASTDTMSKPALTGFLIGSATTIFFAFLVNNFRKKKSEKSTVNSNHTRTIPQALRDEQLSRHTLYFGDKGMLKLKGAKVVIVGLGGVGSHTAHMLARAGVGHLRMIDFDQVSLSSLNRHACATLEDVGTSKASCLKKFLEKICPDPNHLFLEEVVQMYSREGGEELLNGHQWDLVIDAIDDIPTKAALLAHCLKNNIRAISCMGAGGKSDVTRLHISDLRTASRDPLASKLRQSLKRLLPKDVHYMDDMERLSVVYSSEKTVVKLADFTDEQKAEGVHQFGAVDGMRIRVIPVLGTMPAVMGQTLAALAVCELSGKSFSPVTGERVGRNVRNRMWQHLKRREQSIQETVVEGVNVGLHGHGEDEGGLVNGIWVGPLQIDSDDVEYLLEIWRNRCGVTGERLGTVLELVRWDLSKPANCQNLVIMCSKAIQKFDKDGKASVPEDVQKTIEARLQSCRIDTDA